MGWVRGSVEIQVDQPGGFKEDIEQQWGLEPGTGDK